MIAVLEWNGRYRTSERRLDTLEEDPLMNINHGFHATMTAQPGKSDELLELLLNAPSLTNDDCVVFLVGRSAGNPDIVHVTEGWISQDAHGRFFATEEAQELVAKLQPLLAGDSQYTDEIPVGGKATF
jgi:quinol monooxygenase YgiN